jgi:hypothetical protein
MKRVELRTFLRVARSHGKRRLAMGTPSPCFLQEYDSIGVKGWGYAKDVILWELEIKRRLNGKMGLTIGTESQPRVSFVPFAAALGKRVADKGLMLDAASRASTFGKLNAET